MGWYYRKLNIGYVGIYLLIKTRYEFAIQIIEILMEII
jgi:hypothetical protein